ncbi:hypothetical protein [Youxingia wuxianensis]|uniref:Uncharacterized protein n=1 Tax=Youxingia wuxianensis TaxID=2763678 RepID=A0A926EQP0_9FIRM|nr:hypothetical protein [Youxingia wuxianensis]MBC8584902.1 hypothetical protein [Youxingia wuxianensis]
MRKILSALLALVMLISLSMPAYAATFPWDKNDAAELIADYGIYSSDGDRLIDNNNDVLQPGQTVYIKLNDKYEYLTDKNLMTMTLDRDKNGSMISSAKIVEKKFNGKRIPCIEIVIKDTTTDKELKAEFKLIFTARKNLVNEALDPTLFANLDTLSKLEVYYRGNTPNLSKSYWFVEAKNFTPPTSGDLTALKNETARLQQALKEATANIDAVLNSTVSPHKSALDSATAEVDAALKALYGESMNSSSPAANSLAAIKAAKMEALRNASATIDPTYQQNHNKYVEAFNKVGDTALGATPPFTSANGSLGADWAAKAESITAAGLDGKISALNNAYAALDTQVQAYNSAAADLSAKLTELQTAAQNIAAQAGNTIPGQVTAEVYNQLTGAYNQALNNYTASKNTFDSALTNYTSALNTYEGTKTALNGNILSATPSQRPAQYQGTTFNYAVYNAVNTPNITVPGAFNTLDPVPAVVPAAETMAITVTTAITPLVTGTSNQGNEGLFAQLKTIENDIASAIAEREAYKAYKDAPSSSTSEEYNKLAAIAYGDINNALFQGTQTGSQEFLDALAACKNVAQKESELGQPIAGYNRPTGNNKPTESNDLWDSVYKNLTVSANELYSKEAAAAKVLSKDYYDLGAPIDSNTAYSNASTTSPRGIEYRAKIDYMKSALTLEAYELMGEQPAGYLKKGNRISVPIRLYIQNTNLNGDNDITIGEGGIVIVPTENEKNIVTWSNNNGDVLATLTFKADSNPSAFYPKLRTKLEAGLRKTFDNYDVYVRNFVGSSTIDSTSRAVLDLNNPFIDEDGEETVSPNKIQIYQVVDGKIAKVTSLFEYTTNDNDEPVFRTRVRTLGHYIICAGNPKIIYDADGDKLPDKNNNGGNSNNGGGSSKPIPNTGR